MCDNFVFRFHVMVEALDEKEHIELSLNDRTIRKLIGKTVDELLEKVYTIISRMLCKSHKLCHIIS